MTQWYFYSGGTQFGPHEEAEMVQLARGGELKASDNVWNETMGKDWVPASTVTAFFPGTGTQEPGVRVQKNDDSPRPQAGAAPGSSEPAVMQYFSASDESRRAREHGRKPMQKYLAPAIIALVLGGAIFAVRQFAEGGGARGARIDQLVAAGGIHLGSGPRIWIHLEFREPPKAGNTTDVKLVLNSDCFKKSMTFGWAQIAAKPTVPIGKGALLRKPAEGISPGEPPRLNYVFGTSFAIPISNIRAGMDPGSRLQVKAELYWAGEKMHSKKCSVRNWYVRG